MAHDAVTTGRVVRGHSIDLIVRSVVTEQKILVLKNFSLSKLSANRTPIFLVTASDYQVFSIRAVTSVINRYYDPSIDQFLSIDPDVASTDQPYIYSGDDPLNLEDPLGLSPATKALSTAIVNLDARVAAAALNPDAANLAAVKALEKRVSSDAKTVVNQAVAQYVAAGTSPAGPTLLAANGKPTSGTQTQAVENYISDTERSWCYAGVAISAGGSLGMTGMATVSSGVLADGPPAWVAAVAGGITATAIIFTIKLALSC
jgi:hypothetical protein